MIRRRRRGPRACNRGRVGGLWDIARGIPAKIPAAYVGEASVGCQHCDVGTDVGYIGAESTEVGVVRYVAVGGKGAVSTEHRYSPRRSAPSSWIAKGMLKGGTYSSRS